MRSPLPALLAILSLSCGPAPVTPESYLVTGQSNSVSPSNGEPPVWSHTGRVTINDYYHDATRFRVPTQADPNDSGVTWIALGDLLNRPVTFNVIGRGNTSTRVWRNELHPRITAALLAKPYTAILWVQGESDAGEHIATEESYQNLRWVILESRRVQPNIPWYVALDGHGGGARAAQERLISEGLARAGADLDALRQTRENFDPSLGELAGPGFSRYAAEWMEILK